MSFWPRCETTSHSNIILLMSSRKTYGLCLDEASPKNSLLSHATSINVSKRRKDRFQNFREKHQDYTFLAPPDLSTESNQRTIFRSACRHCSKSPLICASRMQRGFSTFSLPLQIKQSCIKPFTNLFRRDIYLIPHPIRIEDV